MNFHSFSFGIFLVVMLTVFWAVSRRRGLRTGVLLIGSYFFYGCYNWWFLGLIAFSTFLDWNCGKAIHKATDPKRRKLFLVVSLAGNLGLLGFFKYYEWGMTSLEAALAGMGIEYSHTVLVYAVPIGISFYTFQTLSYTIDIYRRKLAPARSFLDFAVFVAFFPQLVAGPIVRAVEFIPQLEFKPRFDRDRMVDGFYRIALGLAKKVAIADVLGGYLVDPVYADPGNFTWFVHLLALYGFTFQIYFDFSGYSDIAIGTARLFGFDLPENFWLPYQARSLREFWRRWHISLSSWVRDYIFFPLGGSRRNEPRVWFNLIFTMLVIGLWHGASSLWVVYGLMQGIVMCGERLFERVFRGGKEFATTPLRSAVSWLATFHFIVLSCILIRAQDWETVTGVLGVYGDVGEVSTWAYWALLAAFATHFVPKRTHDRIQAGICRLPIPVGAVLFGIVSGLVAFLVVGETPYIYFQF